MLRGLIATVLGKSVGTSAAIIALRKEEVTALRPRLGFLTKKSNNDRKRLSRVSREAFLPISKLYNILDFVVDIELRIISI